MECGREKEEKALVGCMEEQESRMKERVAVCCFEASVDFHDVKTPPHPPAPWLISSCQCDVNWLTKFLEMNNWLALAAG